MLDKDLTLTERQRLAAIRTHEIRQKKTESRIRAACRQLQQKGEALTQAAIARVAHLSRQTVASCKHVLTEVIKPVAVLDAVTAPTSDVKYGVHQVSAPSSAVFDLRVNGSDLEPVDSS